MLTIGQDALIEGFRTQLELYGKSMQSLSTANVTFTALLQVAPPFDPNTPLGEDPREKVIMEVLSPGPALSLNDRVQEVGNDDSTWLVVWRDANPAHIVARYILARLTDA
jgi:hypothetical protein